MKNSEITTTMKDFLILSKIGKLKFVFQSIWHFPRSSF